MDFISLLFRRQLVGLDIGVSGIKAVELSTKNKPRLLAYNRIPLPWDTISTEGEIRQRTVLVTALKKLFESRQFSTKNVAVGGTGNSIITKKITVPRMTKDELNHQLYWEAEQYIPFNVDEVNVDYAIIGPNNQVQSGTPMMDVLLVAAKKEYIQTLSSIVEEAGLSPQVIDAQPFALGNAFEFNYGHTLSGVGNSVVLIDFGAGTTKLSVVEGDKTTFTRELRQSGIACTAMLSERLGIPLDQAERIKIAEGTTSPIKEILSEYVHILTEEISRTLDFFSSQSPDRTIEGIYICGGASRTEGLVKTLEARVSVPVHPLNPVQNIAGSGQKMNAQAIRELSYLGAVAIGLALRVAGDAR